MVSKEDIQTIEKDTKTLFKMLEVQGEIQVQAKEEEKLITISFKVEEPKLLIGERGQTLFEIQHLLKLMVRKKLESVEGYYISLDINDYKKNKEEYLRDLAITTADEVSLLKKPKELPPMPAAERRMVHAALNERTDVVSESVGEGPERRVVIKNKG